jgi:superfamily II DNA/RNA helicase
MIYRISGHVFGQVLDPVDKDRKRELLSHLVKSGNWQQVLVFCRTKHGANRLAEAAPKSDRAKEKAVLALFGLVGRKVGKARAKPRTAMLLGTGPSL